MPQVPTSGQEKIWVVSLFFQSFGESLLVVSSGKILYQSFSKFAQLQPCNMSLETLLEAAEFLEWSKTGKKSSRGKFNSNEMI